jgi:hypothetical protein
MTARDIPGPDGPHPQEAAEAPPLNRAERRGKARKAGAPAGHGKVQGPKFGGPMPRQYQNRKHG